MKKSLIRSLPSQQRGISLFTVLVMLLLSLVAVLSAFWSSKMNESMLGNASDYNRTRAAADALMRDAELDILGRLPPFTTIQVDGSKGFPCQPTAAGSNITMNGFVGCRNQGAGNNPWFPKNSDDFEAVKTIVQANAIAPNLCFQGICIPNNTTDLSNIENNLAVMAPMGASYGQFTRQGLTELGVTGNPILTNSIASNSYARYWVEAFRYGESVNSGASASNDLIPDPSANFIYRITVVAHGLKAGTRVVLKSYFVPYPASQDQ